MPGKSESLPRELLRLIPKRIEKGIYYRLYPERAPVKTNLIWWVKVWDKNSNAIYESSKSSRYEDAVKLKKKLIASVESGLRAGGDADSVTINELLDDMLDSGVRAKPETMYIYKLYIEKQIRPFFGRIKAAKLTTDHIKTYRAKRKAELVAKREALAVKKGETITDETRIAWKNSAGATINRELARLHRALEHAREHTPPRVLHIPKFIMDSEEENVRKVVMQDSDYMTLRDAFDDPGVQLLFIVSSHVGIRDGELRGIQWSQVDFERKMIILEKRKTKNKDPRSAPIFGDMLPYLKAEKQRHDEFYPTAPWVFSRVGKPIKDFRGEWVKATTRAGVAGLHFHDLRRTAHRLMRRSGIDSETRRKIMGHKTDAMDRRYGVVEDDDVMQSVPKLDGAFHRILNAQPSTNKDPKRLATEAAPGDRLIETIRSLSPEDRFIVEAIANRYAKVP